MNRNAYIDGMMGLVVGDALGVPYEFRSREQMKAESATDMIGYGTYNVPAGTWSDDSSMALATLDALRNGCDLEAIIGISQIGFITETTRLTERYSISVLPVGLLFQIMLKAVTSIPAAAAENMRTAMVLLCVFFLPVSISAMKRSAVGHR